MEKPKIEQIKILIRNDNLGEALVLLKKLCEKSPFESYVQFLTEWFRSLTEQVQKDIISAKEEHTKVASIYTSIVQLLCGFDEYKLESTNLTTNKELRQLLKHKIMPLYETIYKWHQTEGLTDFSQTFGTELGSGAFARKYSDYWDFRESIKTPDTASVNDITKVAQSVIAGCMGWSAKEKLIDKDNLLINAYNIFGFVDNFTLEKKRFSPDTATTILIQKNDKLLKICFKLYPYKQIGGLITVLTLNHLKDSNKIYTPDLLELEASEDVNGLISHIRNGTLSIETMEVEYSESSSIKLRLIILNHTTIEQAFLIPDGQLFEYHKQDIGYQVLASDEAMNHTVMAKQKLVIELSTISITPQLNPIPKDGGLISLYKLNNNFNRQKKNANYCPKGVDKEGGYYWEKVKSYFFLTVPVKRHIQPNRLDIAISSPPALLERAKNPLELILKTQTAVYVLTPLTIVVATALLIVGIIGLVNDGLPYFYHLYHRL